MERSESIVGTSDKEVGEAEAVVTRSVEVGDGEDVVVHSSEVIDAELAYDVMVEKLIVFTESVLNADVDWASSYFSRDEFVARAVSNELTVADIAYFSRMSNIDFGYVSGVDEILSWSIEQGDSYPLLKVGELAVVLTPLTVDSLERGLMLTRPKEERKEKVFTVEKGKKYFKKHRVFSVTTGIFSFIIIVSLLYGLFFMATA